MQRQVASSELSEVSLALAGAGAAAIAIGVVFEADALVRETVDRRDRRWCGAWPRRVRRAVGASRPRLWIAHDTDGGPQPGGRFLLFTFLMEVTLRTTTALMFGTAAAVCSLLQLQCGSDAVSCEEGRSCATGPDGGADGPIAEAGVDAPPGCDPQADVKDAPKCVVSEFGVFVDGAGGNDANAGTKESPVKSIGAALGKLAGKTRVYVCEGTYAEHVKLTSAVSLYGGFACGTWSYSGGKAKVSPTDAGYALEIAGAGLELVVADLDVAAVDATMAGESSVGALVNGASKVLLFGACESRRARGWPVPTA